RRTLAARQRRGKWPRRSLRRCKVSPVIDLNAEGQRYLLRNSWAAPSWISALHLDDCLDELRFRSVRAGFTCEFWRKQEAIFSFDQNVMEMKEGRRSEHDCRTDNTCGTHQKHT